MDSLRVPVGCSSARVTAAASCLLDRGAVRELLVQHRVHPRRVALLEPRGRIRLLGPRGAFLGLPPRFREDYDPYRRMRSTPPSSNPPSRR